MKSDLEIARSARLLPIREIGERAGLLPDDPAQRTFKIVRQPADGLAYARSIAQKHRLTAPLLRERLRA